MRGGSFCTRATGSVRIHWSAVELQMILASARMTTLKAYAPAAELPSPPPGNPPRLLDLLARFMTSDRTAPSARAAVVPRHDEPRAFGTRII